MAPWVNCQHKRKREGEDRGGKVGGRGQGKNLNLVPEVKAQTLDIQEAEARGWLEPQESEASLGSIVKTLSQKCLLISYFYGFGL